MKSHAARGFLLCIRCNFQPVDLSISFFENQGAVFILMYNLPCLKKWLIPPRSCWLQTVVGWISEYSLFFKLDGVRRRSHAGRPRRQVRYLSRSNLVIPAHLYFSVATECGINEYSRRLTSWMSNVELQLRTQAGTQADYFAHEYC